MCTCRLVSSALAVMVILSPNTFAEDEPHGPIAEKLEGRWEIVSGVNQGHKLSEAEVAGTYVVFKTNTISTYDSDQQERFKAIFRIDESTVPMQITMTTVPPDASTGRLNPLEKAENPVALGILKFNGPSKLMLCYGLPGADRPSKFESPKGSHVMLFALRKAQGDPTPNVLKSSPANPRK